MRAFAELITNKAVAWCIVLFTVVVAAFGVVYAGRVQEDDDILAFLPKTNPDVASFYEVADRFGSLDVALVGIESGDALAPEFLQRLKELTKRLNETEGLQFTLSLTSVEDFVADKERGGITADYLVREIPTTPEAEAALRARVLSRDHIVGNLVSEDGKAVMLYVFAAPGAEPRVTANKIRPLVLEYFPNETKYWHGSPFISTYIYELTQADLERLAPWACVAIALVVFLSFRDLAGTVLSLGSTFIGILLPLGIMGYTGIHTNIVLGSMPVILFGLGSAYGVHLLSRYYQLAAEMPRPKALVEALVDVGPSILGSGLTTSFGLLSFVMMDIPPMRVFGWFTALGLTFALVLALVFIPAVLTVVPLKGEPPPPFRWLGDRMAAVAIGMRRRVRLGLGVTLGLVAVGALYASRVSSTLDTTAFFEPDSPPAQADAFMQRHFGGSQFIQVQIRGDMNDPVVLREVQLFADRVTLVPDVTSVVHVGAIVAQTNEAMDDVRRLPDTEDKVRALYAFLAGKRAVLQAVTEEHDVALLHIKVGKTRADDVQRVLDAVTALANGLPSRIERVDLSQAGDRAEAVTAKRAEIVAARISALAASLGAPVADPAALRHALVEQRGQAAREAVLREIRAFMKTEAFDAPIDKSDDKLATAIATGVVELGAPPSDDVGRKAWRAKVPDIVAAATGKDRADPVVDDTSLSLEQNVGDLWIRERARADAALVVSSAKLVIPDSPKGERLRTFLGHALLDLDLPYAGLPTTAGGKPLEATVTGLPVLYRGLSDSVFNNQWNSLWFALVLVVVLKALLFRSLSTGILSSIPTLVTLVLVYGGMGLLGVRLDIGTSMLASLIIGAGDDYAVQYLWSWVSPAGSLDEAARTAARENGAGIWTNALMVAIGFFVLTLGDARPLQNVGGLTAIAMVAAAIATFTLCPLLARRARYAPVHS
jgi:predicted RND superfamily exporter protein